MEKNFDIEVEIKIPFHDVDLAKLVWHGHYVKYFEIARTVLMQKINYDVDQMLESNYGWPIIELKCRFYKPVFYNMNIKIKATLVEFENRLKIAYLIYNPETGDKLCKGHTVQVAVNIETKEMCYESPDILFEKLGLKKKNYS